MCLLQDLCVCYRIYVSVTGSVFLLQDLYVCYRIYVVVTGSPSRSSSFSRENRFAAWFLGGTYLREGVT